MPIARLDEIKARVGKEVGTSGWVLVDQERISAFAEATEDRQFIHVDPQAAARTPFGGIEGYVARIDFDGGAAVVARMSDPAPLAQHREGKRLATPQLGQHRRRALRIVGGNRKMEDHDTYAPYACSLRRHRYTIAMPVAKLTEIKNRVGEEIAVSDWITIDQARIDAFAEATEDRQFIHVDAGAAARTPFGGTIAHGFLTLSLLSRMGAEAMLIPEGMKMAVNYGLDRVRFIAPVRSGKRVRGRFTLDSVEEKAPGQLLLRHIVAVEIEGEEKPALTAVWLGLMFT